MAKKGKKRALNKFIVFGIIFLSVVVIFLFGARIYLFFNYLIGNDVLVKIDASDENLYLVHGQEDKVDFNMRVTANPFCSVICESKFEDLSNGNIIENNRFKLGFASPLKKEYILKADTYGKGQKLYRFSISCSSTKTFLCDTVAKPTIKAILITLNYDINSEELGERSLLQRKFDIQAEKLNYIASGIQSAKIYADKINKTFDLDETLHAINNLSRDTNMIYGNLSEMEDLWQSYDDNAFIKKMNFAGVKLNNLNSSYIEFIGNFSILLNEYNSLAERIDKAAFAVENLSILAENTRNETIIREMNDEISKFNSLIESIDSRGTLKIKDIEIGNFENNFLVFSEIMKNKVIKTGLGNSNIGIISINKSSINHIVPANNSIRLFELQLNEPPAKCCISGKCEDCCTSQKCYENESKYPIIFLHGHGFSSNVPAEASLDDFEYIQEKLEKDGYLNAGFLSPDTPAGLWGMTNMPLGIRASYYFDILNKPDKSILIQSNNENIDTYAVRLNDIINSVKEKTSRKKVIVVAYSMGGLVARRYVQIFGGENINRLILVAVPNKGISGEVAKLCPKFGGNPECDDMDENSTFISKLNSGSMPNIKIYNIFGVGCGKGENDGDGIVLKKSALLDGIENYFINGTCTTINPLHVEILNIQEHPETYEIIKNILKLTN